MSIWHWLIVLGVVVLIFGTNLLGTVGSEIENAILQFKKAIHSPEKPVGIPVWFKVVVGSILVLCLLMAAERLAAR